MRYIWLFISFIVSLFYRKNKRTPKWKEGYRRRYRKGTSSRKSKPKRRTHGFRKKGNVPNR